jgi:iron(III) transport system substrate-binding protein
LTNSRGADYVTDKAARCEVPTGAARHSVKEAIEMQGFLKRAVLAAAASAFAGTAFAQGEVNVYTYRETKLITPLFDAFTKDTGIKVNVVSAANGLEQRVRTEGANSPADVMLTVDISRLEEAVRAGITQPIKSELLDKVVAPRYRDPEGHWYAVSMRARIVYASKERVKQTALNYEDYGNPKLGAKFCIRSGQHYYNTALFAAYIVKHGEAQAEQWLRGLKANLGQRPSGGDRETARDVAAGKCDLGIGNTYYYGLMLNNAAQKPWADATRVILPTFKGGGTHVNVSGVVLARHAPNKANAMKLIEWLAGEKAQQMHADLNFEYPIRAGVPINKTIAAFGALNPDPMPLSSIAEKAKAAANLVDKVGFND